MKYFTKEWYGRSQAADQAQVQGSPTILSKILRTAKHKDTAMKDYHKQLSKIENKLPACLHYTLHGAVITDARREQDALVLELDNSAAFSDVEKLYLYDAVVVEEECPLPGKIWLYEEFSLSGACFMLSALLADENGNLFYFTTCFNSVECVQTLFTDSTEAGVAETLESVLSIAAEESGFDFDKPDWSRWLSCLRQLNGYKISEENLYRYEAGVYSHGCAEMFELVFTRQVICVGAAFQLTVTFYFAPDAQAEMLSDLECSDLYATFDAFLEAVAATPSYSFIRNGGQPLKYSIHAQQLPNTEKTAAL